MSKTDGIKKNINYNLNADKFSLGSKGQGFKEIKKRSSIHNFFGWVIPLLTFTLVLVQDVTANQKETEQGQFDPIAETHNPADFMTLERFNSELAPLLASLQPDNWHMIDIGCGGGIQAQYFANKFSSIQKIVGLDRSGGFVKLAQKNFTDPRLDFVEGDFHNMPFADNTFDFVFSRLTLHYSENMEATFKEIARITKPGGTLYISVAHPIHELFLKPSHDYSNAEEAIFSWNNQVEVKHPTHTESEYVNAISGAKLEISRMNDEGYFETESGYKIHKRLVFFLKKPLVVL